MSTTSARSRHRMTVGKFLAWREDLVGDDARYELVGGVPVRLMSPTSIRHTQILHNASGAIARAGLPCRVFDAGPGVATGRDGDECRIPDVVVTCSSAIVETSHLVPEPLIMVEVASPSTRLADVNDKVEFYGDIPLRTTS